MTQLVIGAGEVGNALAEVLDCDLRDVSPHKGFYSVIHIAFPWSPRFIRNVHAYAGLHEARHVVVHSTVPVGTCDPQGWVHSPVRGRHPDLAKSLLDFPKHFGGLQAPAMSEQWRKRTGGAVVFHSQAATTEAGKLWELATYGVEIAMEKRIHAWCEEHDVPFEEVYTEFGETYNEGWCNLGDHHLAKRLIEHVNGPIGGHCTVEGSRWIEGEPWVRDLLEPHSKPGLWEFKDQDGEH